MTTDMPNTVDVGDSGALRAGILSVLGDIAPEFDLQDLPGDADIRVELEIDSFDLQTYMEELAQRTGIDVPETDYDKVVTIDGCVHYLQRKGGR